jgi:hypothetical protein
MFNKILLSCLHVTYFPCAYIFDVLSVKRWKHFYSASFMHGLSGSVMPMSECVSLAIFFPIVPWKTVFTFILQRHCLKSITWVPLLPYNLERRYMYFCLWLNNLFQNRCLSYGKYCPSLFNLLFVRRDVVRDNKWWWSIVLDQQRILSSYLWWPIVGSAKDIVVLLMMTNSMISKGCCRLTYDDQ